MGEKKVCSIKRPVASGDLPLKQPYLPRRMCLRVCSLCECVSLLVILRATEAGAQDHPQVKLNNLDNLKSIDSAICPFGVIALTPLSVNGLLHLNLDGLSRCYPLTAVEVVLNKEKKN